MKASTRREMSSQLSSHFDPLGMVSPFLLGSRLILQRVSSSGLGGMTFSPPMSEVAGENGLRL